MSALRIAIAAAAASIAMAGSAISADLVLDEPALEMATSGWDGPYVGVGVSYLDSTSISEQIWALDGYVGVNATMDSVLIGAEAYLSARNSDITGWYWALGGEGRVGYVITDAAVLYGALGLEVVEGGNTFATAGGGVEFALTDDVSLDLEYKYYYGLNNSWTGNSVFASVLWHF